MTLSKLALQFTIFFQREHVQDDEGQKFDAILTYFGLSSKMNYHKEKEQSLLVTYK